MLLFIRNFFDSAFHLEVIGMSSMVKRLGLFISSIVFALLLLPTASIKAQTASNAETNKLHALFESEWEWRMKEFPTFASTLGDRRYNDRWEDVSRAAFEARHRHALDTLKNLQAIDRAQLSAGDQLNYDLFKKEYEEAADEYQFHLFLMPLDQRGGIQTADNLADVLRFQTAKDYEDWIARMNAFPAYMSQTMALMREGMRERVLRPKILMQRVLSQIDKQIVNDPQDSPFFRPFKKFPNNLPNADRERLTNAAREAISRNIVPQFKTLRTFFVGEYLPASFDQVGIWQIPNGDAAYAALVHRHTTTNLTPREIHEIGLAEVKRIHGEMEKIMAQVGFKGSLQDFFKYLRTDPQFFYKTPDELLIAYRALAKRIDPNLVKVFKTLPRTPYGVVPIPDNIAPDTTTAYYYQPAADGSRAGSYYVNLYKPESRPKWEMMSLSLHESVPGHHLQIALAQELGDLPKFRRYGEYTAFVEGWGLYAESLGEEMGLYDDPYSKFGQLTYEMWRAVRLVVDTGMHSMHWTRQQAIDFFMQNAAKTELDVTNEIDRYIGDPGQALAYKIGQLKIKSLRERARQELGERFDIREFHDAVLLSGAIPLDILERNINAYIAAKKNQTSATANAR
jgi:uncharacterized protein (DUF885 family)